MHLEGPYINPTRRGAQHPSYIRPPSITEIDQIIAAVRRLRASGHARRRRFRAHSILSRTCAGAASFASMGHSDATYAQAMAGVDAGFSHVTHLFNAMRPFDHREPGIIGVALTDPRLMVEVIADGLHVHPTSARLLIQAQGTEARRARS